MMRKLTLLMVAVFGVFGSALAQIGITIAVSGGSNITCKGRNVTFTSSTTNAGTLPNFQWYVNGVPSPGATGGSFTTNTLSNGDSVTAMVMRSFAPFDSAWSNAIYMTVVANVTPVVTKSITFGSNPGCRDSLIQFTASSVNSGLTPTYRWFLNGTPTTFGAVYNNTTAVTGDRVWVRVIASGQPVACYTRDTSYSDTTTLVRLPTPAVPLISFIGHLLVSDSPNVQWYGPAGILPGATGPTYRPIAQGSYYAVIGNRLCGSGKSNVLIVFPLTVGNHNLAGVQLYPNPTTGLLTITWSAPTTARITVYTPTGQAVLQDLATATRGKVIDLSPLPSGVYFVRLQDEHGQSGTVRVTVTH